MINYLRFRTRRKKGAGRSRIRKPVIEHEGIYRCSRCLTVLYSDIRYKEHDCYEGRSGLEQHEMSDYMMSNAVVADTGLGRRFTKAWIYETVQLLWGGYDIAE